MLAPSRSDRARLSRVGVRTTAPSMRRAAASMSSRVKGRSAWGAEVAMEGGSRAPSHNRQWSALPVPPFTIWRGRQTGLIASVGGLSAVYPEAGALKRLILILLALLCASPALADALVD